ncbi:MAG: molybdenum cofactor biosynthesis protein MoaE [Pseudomonadota bacterium]
MGVAIQSEPFDPGHELNAFEAGAAGAVVSFTGVVRDVQEGLIAMEIEHYPAMTQTAITAFVDEAIERFSLSAAHVIHRHGRLLPGACIMMVLTAAPHRGDAFAGAEYLMDYLKSRAPFWKKEITKTGEAWVDATSRDEDRLARW